MKPASHDRPHQADDKPPRDVARGDAGRDLRGRLADLSRSHPSSADYGAGRGPERRPDSRERPQRLARPPDKAADRQRGDREAAIDFRWPSDIVALADRRTHILDGEPGDGGGHRAGTGKPGRTEFPRSWTDDRIIDAALSVARHPDQPPLRQAWNNRWRVSGTRDGVAIVAIVESDGRIWTAWPRQGSPGVVKNAKQRTSDGRV